MPHRPFPISAVLAGALCLPGAALAINGAQLGGNGVRNASMGGASIALPLDANAAANNPAGMAFVPTSATLDLQVFRGHSTADYVLPGNRLENRQTIAGPQGGLNWQLSSGLAVGFSVSGGGSGSDYRQAALPVPGAGKASSTLRVAEFVPTLAWKPAPGLAVGFGLTLARQQFEADGVIVPAPVPGGLLPLQGHGSQSSTGAGWRVGALWKPVEAVTLGANYKARTRMGKLDGYDADLLAYSAGRLDVPEQYGVGVAWQASPGVTIAADWLRILWGQLKVMQDPNGFGWRNQPVLRIGVSWQADERLTLRAGFSRNHAQIDSSRATQNLLVPAIHDKAFTVGLSWALDPKSELSLGYEFNPRTTLTGTGASTGTNLTSQVQMFMAGWQQRF
ncbi:outer membrane protein transport protein [Pelomonas sp. P7]|uniref:Outer membrane protein transport protein n=1 Tax=Pelomonas caseinilytica TaxID=2906763 RepID=A0ABS8XBK2_9BURK|nr:outer membrane protein transport protein [Pelomonas sp. P7]MCE4535694.1 outer membrane protein transport protein [Pelomonas sp. P7]